MAKVMISMPDELLAQIDSIARSRGLTRSATIRAFTEAGVDDPGRGWDAVVDALERQAKPRGGNSAQLIRDDRNR